MSDVTKSPQLKSYHIPVDLNAIGMMDAGKFGKAVDKALTEIRQDILARPFYGGGKVSRRTLKIDVEFLPIVRADDFGQLQLVGISATPSLAVSKPKVTGSHNDLRIVGGPKAGEQMVMNREITNNFNQAPLKFPDEE